MDRLLKKLGASDRREALQLLWQFVKFGVVGLSNTAVSWAVYYLFLWIRNDLFMAQAGVVVGWVAGVLNSFIWSRKYVFQESTELWWRALMKMYVGNSAALLVTMLLTQVLVGWCGIPAKIAPFIIMFVTIPMNFLISKYWSFNARKK